MTGNRAFHESRTHRFLAVGSIDGGGKAHVRVDLSCRPRAGESIVGTASSDDCVVNGQ